ncbi:MAG: hypothetical protein AABZ12_05465 [Planctomycetota bacterium]
MALERELKTYQRELANLLQHEGRFVLVHGSEVAGVFDTYDDAIRAGYDKYGLDPFLVKRVEAIEQIQSFTRPLDPCRT